MCLYRLKPSLAGAVTSADRTDPISLRRLRLPRLVLSRSVRFTNRFTRQANDLQFPAPLPPFHCCHLWVRGTMSGLAKRLARHSLDAGDASPRGVPDVDYSVLGVSADTRPARWHRPRRCPAQAPPPNPTATGPDGRRVLSRVGAADHAVTPKAPWTGSGWREYSYGGFGGGHPPFHPHAFCRQPEFHNLHYQLGKSVALPTRCLPIG
jgi:hypothetical protein